VRLDYQTQNSGSSKKAFSITQMNLEVVVDVSYLILEILKSSWIEIVYTSARSR
jgi:hypothetical protein